MINPQVGGVCGEGFDSKNLMNMLVPSMHSLSVKKIIHTCEKKTNNLIIR